MTITPPMTTDAIAQIRARHRIISGGTSESLAGGDIKALLGDVAKLLAEVDRLRQQHTLRAEAISEQASQGWTNEQRIAIRCVFDWLVCAAVNRDEPLSSALWDEAADMLATMMPDHARQWHDLGEYRKRYEAAEAERDAAVGRVNELIRLVREAQTLLENDPDYSNPETETYVWGRQADIELGETIL